MKEITWSKEFLVQVLCIHGEIEHIQMDGKGNITVSYTPSPKKKSKGVRLFEAKTALFQTDEIFKGSSTNFLSPNTTKG